MEKLKKTLNSCKKDILKKDNVVGVGIGKKEVAGKKTNEDSIIIFVTKKKKKDEISAKNLVPAKVKGIKTDVIEIGDVRALPATDRVRPAYPGVSIGHYKVSAGTLGAVVRSTLDGQRLILSNNHVLANITNGKDGRAEKGDEILQPGPADGGTTENDVIAHLYDFVPLVMDTETPECRIAGAAAAVTNKLIKQIRPNYKLSLERVNAAANKVDAALAKPINKNAVKSEIPEIGHVKGVKNAEVGDKIIKMGRTSGLTEGRIDAIDVSLVVKMSDGIQAYFEEQIVTDLKSLPGDSGSLVLTEEREATGLLFAGSDTRTIINPISNVMRELRIAFD